MNDFIAFFLLFKWFMLVYYKTGIPVKLYNIFQNKFIDQLTECEFCQESHISTIMCFFYYLYCGDEIVLFYGFMSASLSNILKK
jgi:hypothetical protein